MWLSKNERGIALPNSEEHQAGSEPKLRPFIVVMRDDAIALVGPFNDIDEVNAYTLADPHAEVGDTTYGDPNPINNSEDDPRWQVLYLNPARMHKWAKTDGPPTAAIGVAAYPVYVWPTTTTMPEAAHPPVPDFRRAWTDA